MTCPLTMPDALEVGMSTCTPTQSLPIEAGDPQWVADLFDTLREGDLDSIVDQLDALVRVMRRAAKARRMLATVDSALLREGFALRESRSGAAR